MVGSPTINNGLLYSISGILEMIRGLKFKGKKAAAFGCYGWSGESVKLITQALEKSKFDVINDGIKALWVPDKTAKEACIEFGKEIAKA